MDQLAEQAQELSDLGTWLESPVESDLSVCAKEREEPPSHDTHFERSTTEEKQSHVSISKRTGHIEIRTELENVRAIQQDQFLQTSPYNNCYGQNSKSFREKDQCKSEKRQCNGVEELHTQYFEDIKIYLQEALTEIRDDFDFKLNSCKAEMAALVEKCDEEMVSFDTGGKLKVNKLSPGSTSHEAQNDVEGDREIDYDIEILTEELYSYVHRFNEQQEIIVELESNLNNLVKKNRHLQTEIRQYKENEGAFVNEIRCLNEQVKHNSEQYHMKSAEMKRIYDEGLKLLVKDMDESQALHAQEILDLTAALDKQQSVINKLESELMEAKKKHEIKQSDLLSRNKVSQLKQYVPQAGSCFRKLFSFDLLNRLNEIKAHLKRSTNSECETRSAEALSNENLESITCLDLPKTLQIALYELMELTKSFYLSVNCEHSEPLMRQMSQNLGWSKTNLQKSTTNLGKSKTNLQKSTTHVEGSKTNLGKSTTNMKKSSTNVKRSTTNFREDEDGRKGIFSRLEKDSYCGLSNTSAVENKVLPEETERVEPIPLKSKHVLNLDNNELSTGTRVHKCSLNRLHTLHLLSSGRSFSNALDNHLLLKDLQTYQMVSDGVGLPKDLYSPDFRTIYDRREDELQLLNQISCSRLKVKGGGDYHGAEEKQEEDLMSFK